MHATPQERAQRRRVFVADGCRDEGRIAQALMGKADELLASPPDLRMADVLAAK